MSGRDHKLRLRFPAREIGHWAGRYRYPGDDEMRRIGLRARRRGYFLRSEFLELCRWKSPRTGPRCEENSASLVRAATAAALGSREEQFRVEVLTLLRGVDWPTASVLLHFGARQPYPILDFRALWSLGADVPPRYTFAFWWTYVKATRELSAKLSVPMRDLDRALWQYSKEHQPPAK